MKKLSALALGLMMSVPCLFAQGTDILPFIRIDRNPVTSALAGAGSASVQTAAWSAFSGASTLPFYDGTMDASLSYQLWTPSLSASSHVNVGAAYKVAPRIGVSLGYAAQLGEPFGIMGSAGIFRPVDHLVALGAGFGIGEKFSVGVNGRFGIQAARPSQSLMGFSADLSVGYRPVKAVCLTAGVYAIGPKIDGYSQPASAGLAGDWTFDFANVHSLDLLADVDYYFSGRFSAAAGLQYSWAKTVFVRAGYRYSTPGCVIPSHLGLGVGASFAGLRLDVSWLTASEALANTLCAGVSYGF